MKKKSKPNQWIAWCWRSGEIGIGRKMPESAIPLFSGTKKYVRDTVLATARESYPSKPGAQDTYPLVPGVPEAEDEMAALDAVIKYRDWIESREKKAKKKS